MTRSERLAREGKITVDVGELAIAKVVSESELARTPHLRYIGTDPAAMYDGREVSAAVYENDSAYDLELYAVVTL